MSFRFSGRRHIFAHNRLCESNTIEYRASAESDSPGPATERERNRIFTIAFFSVFNVSVCARVLFGVVWACSRAIVVSYAYRLPLVE